MRIFLLFLPLLFVAPAAAQDHPASDAPYVFYYSAALNGFVIERADGTDSRIIGQNVMEQPAEAFTGPGWSPSGRWLAWRTIHPDEFGYGLGKGYLIGIDGQQFDLLSEFKCVDTMLWHRTKDLLLVDGQIDGSCNRQGIRGIVTYWLIDAAKQSIIGSVSIESWQDPDPALYWFDESIQFKETPLSAERYYLITMYYDGQIHISPLSREEFFTPIEGGERDLRGTSADNSEDRQFIYTMYTDSYVPLPFNPPMNSSALDGYVAYLWSEDANWLFIGYESCGAGGSPGRVSIYNPSTGLYREISSCDVDIVCVDWLPERVPVNDLPAGLAKSVLPTPLFYNWDDSWAAQGFANAYVDAVVTHELRCYEGTQSLGDQVVNLETGILDYVSPQAEPCTPFDGEPEFPQIIFAFSPDKKLYAITDKTGYTRLHDAATGERLVTLNFEGIHLSFSENGRTLYTVGRYASATWDIEAIVTPITMNNLPMPPQV